MGFTNDVPFIQVYVDGVVSKMLGELEIGSEINFKHLKRNIKQQYPFRAKKKLTMVCGGTGITPMYQALQTIVKHPEDPLEVVLVSMYCVWIHVLLVSFVLF